MWPLHNIASVSDRRLIHCQTLACRIRTMSENPIRYGTSVLLIGSKNYSSWSLRPWLFLRKADFKFREQDRA